ncbi:MAG: acyltransferase [Acidobacteria bacterium]|nr:acyltransferase [Acidobacteriota bacterium]
MTEQQGLEYVAATATAASTSIGKAKLPHFKALDGVRGIAALVVFVHHFAQTIRPQQLSDWNWFFHGVFYLSQFGASGVDVFFVLSGYLITSLLLIDRGKPNYFHNFYWKRALRILPVYLVHLVFTQWLIGDAWGYIWLSLIFLVNFDQRFHVEAKGVAWTLSIEEQFYLIWPQFVRRLRLSSLYYLAFALVIGSFILRLAVQLRTHSIAITYTPYRCDGLGLGVLLALQWFNGAPPPRAVQPLLRILNSRTVLMLSAAGAIVVLSIPINNITIIARITVVNLLAYHLIRRIIQSDRPAKAFSWLGRDLPVHMGNISYSLYLYHPIVLFVLAKHFNALDPTHPWKVAGFLLLAFAIVFTVSTLSLFVMERPMQRLRRFVLK